jgi:hypothetical protein
MRSFMYSDGEEQDEKADDDGWNIHLDPERIYSISPEKSKPETQGRNVSILILIGVRDQHADFPSEESRRGTMPVQSSQGLPHPPSLSLFNSVYI